MCNDPLSSVLEKDFYATYAQTYIQVEVHKLSRGLIKLLREFNWTQVAILYENRTSYVRMKDVMVEQFKANHIEVRLQKELLDEKCYSRLLYGRECEWSNVKNVSVYMENMFKELKEEARSE